MKPLPQKPLPCRFGVSSAGAPRGSDGYTPAWSNGGCEPIDAASPPTNEDGSFTSPGPVVAVCTSRLKRDISNVSVSPTFTVRVGGKNEYTSTPPGPPLPIWIVSERTVATCS